MSNEETNSITPYLYQQLELSYKSINLYDNSGYLFKSKLCNEYDYIANYYPSKRKLQSYQKIPSNYLQINSKFKSLLVFIGTGLGKTIVGINNINNLHQVYKKLNVIIICPAALKEATWKPSLSNWLNDKSLNVQYISIDSPTFSTEFDIISKSITTTIPTLFIIDECHIFTSSLVDENSNRKTVYNNLINIIKHYNTYLICLTATPIVNRVEELIYLFNLLRPDTFHSKESIFIDMFTNSINGQLKNQHIFCKRITGLVSYFESVRKKEMPDVHEYKIKIPMSKEQSESYDFIEKEEMRKGGGYKQSTIGATNFTLPLELLKSNSVINITDFIKKADLNLLEKLSPKFTHIINTIKTAKRPNVVHSSYIESTILPLEQYLLRFGYYKNDGKSKIHEKKMFAIVTGKTPAHERERILKIFNSKENMYGNLIFILIISDAFSMGVSLYYAENVFILNYHWNLMKKIQIDGRVVRLTTHADLPIDERFVNNYIYISKRSRGISADDLLEKTSIQKDQKINMFLDLIKISAIDFDYNKLNPEFLLSNMSSFKPSLHEISLNKPYMTRSIMDEDGIFKNTIIDLKLNKINTRQINVVYMDSKNKKHIMKVLLIYPIYNYYIVDIKYFNYIGYLILENNKPVFDKEYNYFIASILV